MDKVQFSQLKPSEQVLHALKNRGQQSSADLCALLNMKKKNLNSVVSRLSKAGKIERVSFGVYKLKQS